jgi:hypothetical protein
MVGQVVCRSSSNLTHPPGLGHQDRSFLLFLVHALEPHVLRYNIIWQRRSERTLVQHRPVCSPNSHHTSYIMASFVFNLAEWSFCLHSLVVVLFGGHVRPTDVQVCGRYDPDASAVGTNIRRFSLALAVYFGC